jgi:hypothetical protein
MSLLKRFIIRPIGVDSKNCILLRIIDLSIESCNVLDDLTSVTADAISAIIENVS